MLIITKTEKGYDMELTRGDTLTLEVGMSREIDPIPPATEPTIVPYTPAENDVIRFAVSKGYKGDSGYELKIEKTIPHDTLKFTCSSEETSLDYMTYHYDVEITYADGTVDTFIEGSLTITGESE